MMLSSVKDGYIDSRIEVNVPQGASQTIGSDVNLKKRNDETFEINKAYFNKKIEEDFKVMGSWNIDRRRANEWLL